MELPKEIFLGKMYLVQGSEPMKAGSAYADIPNPEDNEAVKYVRTDLAQSLADALDSMLFVFADDCDDYDAVIEARAALKKYRGE